MNKQIQREYPRAYQTKIIVWIGMFLPETRSVYSFYMNFKPPAAYMLQPVKLDNYLTVGTNERKPSSLLSLYLSVCVCAVYAII